MEGGEGGTRWRTWTGIIGREPCSVIVVRFVKLGEGQWAGGGARSISGRCLWEVVDGKTGGRQWASVTRSVGGFLTLGKFNRR